MLFLGIAIMGMTTLFAHEVRRTRTALAEAQLRQLLLAAVPAAQEQLRANTATRDVPLTVPIEEATVNLHIANSTVTVEAHLRGFKATQTLQFDNGKLISATLTQTAGQ
jgi:Tfp pilus assembly protein PilV